MHALAPAAHAGQISFASLGEVLRYHERVLGLWGLMHEYVPESIFNI